VVGLFLSDVGARGASGSASGLALTLLGFGDCDCDRAGAGRPPATFSPAAQLFTTSLRLALQDRFARSSITATLISAATVPRKLDARRYKNFACEELSEPGPCVQSPSCGSACLNAWPNRRTEYIARDAAKPTRRRWLKPGAWRKRHKECSDPKRRGFRPTAHCLPLFYQILRYPREPRSDRRRP
jgi:hypothetical protein